MMIENALDQQLTDEAVWFLVNFFCRLPFHQGKSLAQHHQGSEEKTAAKDWGKCHLHLHPQACLKCSCCLSKICC